MMTSSESEDEKEIQEDLWQHLSAYLDDQIGESNSFQKKKRKSLTKCQQTNRGDIRLADDKRTPTEQVLNSVSRVKELTTALKKQSQLSRTSEVCKQKQNIKNKMREMLQRPSLAGRSEVMSHGDDNELAGGDDEDEFSDDDDECDDLEECDDDNDADDDGSDAFDVGDVESSSVSSKSAQLEKFKQALGISEADFDRTHDEQQHTGDVIHEERVKTIALSKNNKQRPPPTVVVFEDRKTKAKQNKVRPMKSENAEAVPDEDSPTFDLKRARFEVRKFGISGLHGTEKEAGMIDLLVKLGAKPPKREYVNYKDLQQKKKEELEKAAAKQELDRSVGFKIVKSGNKKRHRRDRNDIGVVDGQVGSYRQGVQVISKKHLQQLTNNKHKK